MSLVKRIRHSWAADEAGGDKRKLRAVYEVEGEEKTLIALCDTSSGAMEDPATLDWLLRVMDEEAEWAAEHPDEVPTAQLEWT